MDPEGEYTPLVKALGGAVMCFAVGGSDWLNAMAMEEGYGEGSPVAFKSQFIIQQFENREKMLRQKLSKEERRTRSHRLIVRGAVFESIVPEAKNMTDEEATALLRLALTSEPAREYLKKRAEGGKSK